MIPYNKKLVLNARTLRKNMTPEEKHLWYDFLKRLPFNVRRQHNIENYIVDFYIAEAKLVIELDGSQHYEKQGLAADTERDHYMRSIGLTVLRYSNLDVNRNFSGVCQDILNHIPANKPSPRGEGGCAADG